MLKYFVTRLFESSTWIGLAIIIGAFIAPRWFIILMGAILVVSGDNWIKQWVRQNMPTIAKILDEGV